MLSLTRSHLTHLSRFAAAAALYTALLLAITFLMAAAPGTAPQTLEVGDPSFNFVLEDLDQSELSHCLTTHLESLYTRRDKPEDQAMFDERLLVGEIHASVHIPENFQASFATGEQEIFFDFAPNIISGYTVQNEINRFMALANTIAREKELLNQDPAWDQDDYAKLETALQTRSEIALYENPHSVETSINLKHLANVRVMGYTYLVAILTICTQFANTYRNGSIQARLRLGMVSNLSQLMARVTAEFLLAFITLTIMLGGSTALVYFALGDVSGFLTFFPRLIPAALLIGLNGIAMSHLLSHITNTQTSSPAVTVISLGLAFISGAFVPREFLTDLPLTLARFAPLYYYIDIIEGSSPHIMDYWLQYSVLILMAAILFALNLFIQRYKPSTNLMTIQTEN